MADHILETKILLRYGTYGQWMNSDLVLMPGEAAIATFPYERSILGTNITPDRTPPAIGIKIGDGEHYFRELPWVQAVAADVYNWAKSAVKPTYKATEIQGLAAYVEEHSGGGSSGSAAARQYQIIQGTDEDVNKYFLRYRDIGTEEWLIDNTHYVDLEDLAKIKKWIGADLTNFNNLAVRTDGHIQMRIGELNKSDTAVEHQFVTSVSESAGKITVSRSVINFEDITGTLGVSQGGLGVSTLPVGEVLIGNGTNGVQTLAIDRQIDENNKLVPNYVIKAYVDQKTAGLTGAMHYVGTATTDPETNNDPQINDYDFTHAQRGDVILWQQKEYVWTGGYWRLLGDEGSYAVKGSIVDADIDKDANISQTKIYNLISDLDSKVDKIIGKGLSTNDYTNAEKLKLEGIEAGAQRNTINTIKVDNTILPIQDYAVNINISELYSTQLEKLASIEAYANVNSIEIISLNGTPQPIVDKEVNLIVREFSQAQQTHLESIAYGAEVNTIVGIKLDNELLIPQERIVNIDIANTYKNQLDKLATIATGAQVNIIEHITVDGTEIRPNENKIVAITTDPHIEHINKIEHILINGVESTINTSTKTVDLILTEQTLPLFLLKGAVVPNGQEYENLQINSDNKIVLNRIAKTGDVKELVQTANTYIIIDCGTSDSDIHITT